MASFNVAMKAHGPEVHSSPASGESISRPLASHARRTHRSASRPARSRRPRSSGSFSAMGRRAQVFLPSCRALMSASMVVVSMRSPPQLPAGGARSAGRGAGLSSPPGFGGTCSMMYSDSAVMVRAGLTPRLAGTTLPSATYMLS